jgi:hypothetical protein
MTKQNHFYSSEEFTPTLTQMREILKRESVGKSKEKSLSEWIREQITEYVKLHEPGNPQQRVDHDWSTGKPYKALGICGFRDCGKNGVASGVFLPNGKKFLLCSVHLIVAKGDKRTWKILS